MGDGSGMDRADIAVEIPPPLGTTNGHTELLRGFLQSNPGATSSQCRKALNLKNLGRLLKTMTDGGYATRVQLASQVFAYTLTDKPNPKRVPPLTAEQKRDRDTKAKRVNRANKRAERIAQGEVIPARTRHPNDAARREARRLASRLYHQRSVARRPAKPVVVKAPKPVMVKTPKPVQPVVRRQTEKPTAQRTKIVAPVVHETFPDTAAFIAANADKVERLPAAWEREA